MFRVASPALGLTALTLLAWGCGGRQQLTSAELLPETAPPPSPDDDDTALAERVDAARVVARVRARNPELLALRARVSAAVERASAEGALPDLELKYELWGAPLARPYRLDQAETHMIGLLQTLPPFGTRAARREGAEHEARALANELRGHELALIAQARRSVAEYYLADREYRIHREHVELTAGILELARGHYQSGRNSQQDVLRLSVDLARLHADVSAIEQQRDSAVAKLNALMDRAGDAPLGPPEPPDIRVDNLEPAADLEAEALAHSPALAAAHARERKSEADLDAAQHAAWWPSLMLGLDYWFMPTLEEPHAYGVMAAISLPWLSSRYDDERSEAEHALAAERHSEIAARNAARYGVRDARARVAAARTSYTILEREVLPEAQRSFEAAQASFAAGQSDALGLLDALRSLLMVRLELTRATASLAFALADLDQATGASIDAGSRGGSDESR